MKIIRIIARLNIGGPAIHVVLLTRGLQQRGHESHLLAGPVPENEGDMEYFARQYDVPVTHIAELVRPLSPREDWLAFCKIYRLLRREKPDIVHTHTSKAGTLGRAAAILAGVPVLFHTFHGSVFDGYFSPAKARLFLAIERTLARFTDRVITVSKALREQLSDVYKIAPRSKIEVVRLGFDLEEFSEVAANGRRINAREAGNSVPLVVGWVGRFTDIKDPLLFVEVAAALKSAGLPVKFTMVGDGPLRPEIESHISEDGLSPDFTLTGWQRSMPGAYAGIDILVSTSINEGTPVTIIEGMATGCPFVAPNVGGIIDLAAGAPVSCSGFDIFSNGILVSRRDVDSFVRAASVLASESQLRIRMGEEGRTFALAKFDQERMVSEIESLYGKFMRSQAARVAQPNRLIRARSKE